MTALAPRAWLSPVETARIDAVAGATAAAASGDIVARIERLAAENRRIHERDCFNLNPATNSMNPRAEALLASGLGTRPSLGYPGDKYEMGLEAIEEIEVIAAELVAEIFQATHVEIRVGSGALANLYAFMALARPGDAIIAPPASVGGHVTHHAEGCAGLYGLIVHPAPIGPDTYTVDLDALRTLARTVRPKIITIGMSLNLFPHPVAEIRAIADAVGAHVLFDAAHQCGMIAVAKHAAACSICAEFVEVESGKRADRPQLAAALAACRAMGAALIVAKLDRLARDARFLLSVVDGAGEAGVVFCDLPALPTGPVGRFMLTQMAAVAELERGLIAERTRAALAAAKARGVKLGGARDGAGNVETARNAREANQRRAAEHAARVAPYVAAARKAGAGSLSQIAEALTARGVATPSGRGAWSAMAVSRVMARAA